MSHNLLRSARVRCLGLSLLSGCHLVAGLDDFRVEDSNDAAATDAATIDAAPDEDASGADGDVGGDGSLTPGRDDGGVGLDAGDDDGQVRFDAAVGDTASSEDTGNSPDGSADVDETGPPPCTGLVCDGVCVASDTPNHCGSCSHDCTKLPNVSGVVSCVAGQCVFSSASCAPGFAHCSTNPEDGCEVDLSQSAHCGSCGTACSGGTPLCVGSVATRFACASGCNASAPTLCGQTCVDTSSSPAHCNGCNMACPTVTGGQAVCRSSTCDLTCNTDRHRCGNTCAPNDSITQCGTGCVTCPQPTGGTAACVSGSCTLSCATDYVKSGNTCLSKYIYVSSTGSDSNNGTSVVTPLRSFGKAMSIAVAGQTVRFAAGTYGSATGDTFAQQVPDRVNLERSGTTGTVRFLSNGSGSLVLAGSANLSNLSLDGFAMPLGLTGGSQTLNAVSVVNATGAMVISGTAKVTWQSGGISGAPTSTEMLLIQDSATLTWTTGSLRSLYADCSVTTSGIRAVGSSSVTISGFNMSGKWNSSFQTSPLVFQTHGAIDISSGTFNNECGDTSATMTVGQSTTATLNVLNCYWGGQVQVAPLKSTKFRQSSFHAAAGIYFLGDWNGLPIDLGKAGDAGGNSFGGTTAAAIAGFGVNNMIIDAAGNTWVPSQQGADANGRYTAGSTLSNPTSGRNFQLIGSNNLLRF